MDTSQVHHSTSTTDPEKTVASPDVSSDLASDTYSPRHDAPLKETGVLGRLRYFEARMDQKLGVESNGPDRVLPEDKRPGNPLVMMFMWWSATMNLSCFATGLLGYEFGLALKQTIPLTIFASLIGSATTVSGSSHSW